MGKMLCSEINGKASVSPVPSYGGSRTISLHRAKLTICMLQAIIMTTCCSRTPIVDASLQPRPSLKTKTSVVDIDPPMTLGAGMGMLLISTVDAAGKPIQSEAYLDGDYLGIVFSSNTTSPFLISEIGKKSLELRSPGYYPVSQMIVIAEDRLTRVSTPMNAARLTKGTDDVEWVFIKGDILETGERPHMKLVVPSFEIMKSEVTVRQYEACVDAGICAPTPDQEFSEDCNFRNSARNQHPVNCVELANAAAYCRAIGGRLPTEAEWEFAASSGNAKKQYPWGNHSPSCDVAVMFEGGLGCGENHTWPVCSKPAGNTDHGLCDMAGNVDEWTSGIYDNQFYSSRNQETHVLRGGSWSTIRTDNFETSFRGRASALTRESSIGFRCVRELSEANAAVPSTSTAEREAFSTRRSALSSTWEARDPRDGRLWLKCAAGQWLDDTENCMGEKTAMYWPEALRVCPTGYRLPTREEAADILGGCEASIQSGEQRGNCAPCSRSEGCTAMFSDDNDLYWTSTPLQDSYDAAWLVDFENGEVACMPTTLFAAKARCIRE